MHDRKGRDWPIFIGVFVAFVVMGWLAKEFVAAHVVGDPENVAETMGWVAGAFIFLGLFLAHVLSDRRRR